MALRAGYYGLKNSVKKKLEKLAADMAGSLDYSTTEQNTGAKWIDGKDIYTKTLVFDTAPANGTVLLSGVSDVVNAYGEQLYSGSGEARYYHFPYPDLRWELIQSSHNVTLLNSTSNVSTCKWTFFYTKIEEE